MKTLFTLLFLVCGFVAFAQSPINVNLRKLSDSVMIYTVRDTATRSVTFKAKDLLKQRAAIMASKMDFVKARNVEIAQIDSLLVKFKILNIKQ